MTSLRQKGIDPGTVAGTLFALASGLSFAQTPAEPVPPGAPGPALPTIATRMHDLQPGPPVPKPMIRNPLEGDARAVREGERLFSAFNCVGCHSHGGGGMGPPLMNRTWIYGSDPANVYATIVEGRPNGMPSFGAKIPPEDIWRLVAYVRALGGVGGMELKGTLLSMPLEGSPVGDVSQLPAGIDTYYKELAKDAKAADAAAAAKEQQQKQ